MNPDFSERQYEAAVNQEIVLELGSLLSHPLPRIPSTRREAKLGWDAKFEAGSYWYFLQYKVAVYASREFHWNAHFWAAHRRDYFRFELHSNSQGLCHQHQRLSRLSERQPGVYYCCPLFVTEEDFWRHVDTGGVFQNSALIDIGSVHLPSLWGRHQISYDVDGRVLAWSEPGEESLRDRAPSIRRDPANLRRMTNGTIANLVADAAEVWAVTGPRGDVGPDFASSLILRRLPVETRRRVGDQLGQARGELKSMLSELLDVSELLATAGRILALDFELAFFIEPADSHGQPTSF